MSYCGTITLLLCEEAVRHHGQKETDQLGVSYNNRLEILVAWTRTIAVGW